MPDARKNPLLGAFRSPAPETSPPPKDAGEKTPFDLDEKSKAAVSTATKPGEAQKPTEPLKGAKAGAAPVKPNESKKPAEPSKDTKAAATPAKPDEAKKPAEPPKDTKAGATPPKPDEGKKPTEPPKDTKAGATPPKADEGKKPAEAPKEPQAKVTPPKPDDGKKPAEPTKDAKAGAVSLKPDEAKKPAEPPKDTKSGGVSPKPDEAKKPAEPPKDAKAGDTPPKANDKAEGSEIPTDFKLDIVPEGKLGTVTMIPIDLIDDFEGHPFHVKDDKDMQELVGSVKQFGLLEPTTIIRNAKKFGRFEMVAGHRRKHAAKLAGLTHIPAIVRDMDHDEATIYMVDSNLKRENISPMEKARAYQMKTDAMKRKAGRRSKDEIAALEAQGKKPMTADEELAQQTGESVATVQRFKTLNKLTPPLQQMVDDKKIPVSTAADIAQMKKEEQDALADAIQKEDKVPSGTAAKELKEASKAGTLTTEKIEKAVAPTKRETNPVLKVTFTDDELRDYFPKKDTTVGEVKRTVFEALELRKKALARQAEKAKEKGGSKATPTR